MLADRLALLPAPDVAQALKPMAKEDDDLVDVFIHHLQEAMWQMPVCYARNPLCSRASPRRRSARPASHASFRKGREAAA